VDKYLQVYPNPAKNLLYIQTSVDSGSDIKISIYNASGKMLQTNTLPDPKTGTEYSIDISTLTEGVYFLKLNLAEYSMVRKLVVK